MYGSSYFDDDDEIPAHNFNALPYHSKDSYSGPPLWVVLPIVFTVSFAIYAIIKICCCKNSSRHNFDPSTDVNVHQTSENTYDSHAVSNNTSHSHSVSHDLQPSYAAAVGSASAVHCASDSGAGYSADSGGDCGDD